MNKERDFLESFFLSDNIRDYRFVSQAEITVPAMDDKEEMQTTDVSTNAQLYKLTLLLCRLLGEGDF